MEFRVASFLAILSFAITAKISAMEDTKILPDKSCGQTVTAHIDEQKTVYETKGTVYTSPGEWSGNGKAYSDWYYFTTPPAPSGCRTADVEIEMVGDRRCDWFHGAMQGHWWAQCKVAGTKPDGSVVVAFKMQGHEAYENAWQWNPGNQNSILGFSQQPSRAQSAVKVRVFYLEKSGTK